MIYCPVCYNDTLRINPKGVIEVIINNKQMDAGRFLFNLEKEDEEEFKSNLLNKIEEFFRWYGNFQNKEPINKVEIISPDFTCTHKCKIQLGFKASIIDVLISSDETEKLLKTLSTKYDLEIDF